MSSSDCLPTEAEFTFRNLPLSAPLLEAVEKLGYVTPTPIQRLTIPHVLAGRDVLGQAQTGTGKTAAFALPLLDRIDVTKRGTQVLVLAPTRELAIQVSDAFERYGQHIRGLRTVAIYGGQDYQLQFRELDRGVHIVVGTPGRVMDHMRRGSLSLQSLNCLVLDEADEMLRMGFAEDVEWILSQAPEQRQIALFSATMPDPIRRIAQQHLRDPQHITIEQRTATADTIRQRHVVVSMQQKMPVLARVLEAEPIDGVIVFVKTKSTTEPVAEYLQQQGHRAVALNGDIAQKQRERIIDNLRSGRVNVVVATDVAARGLDVQRISHVINYDLPFDSEAYVHRIGRTGRAGRSGEAILFVQPRERRLLQRLEHATRHRIEPMEIPTNRVINKQRIDRFHDRITQAMAHPEAATYASIITQFQRKNEGVAIEQIAAALAAMAQGDQPLLLQEELKMETFERRSDARHPAQVERRLGARRERGSSRDRDRNAGPMDTYRIEVGGAHGAKPGNIVGAIANEIGIDSEFIGRISIYEEHSTVDLPVGLPADLFQELKKVRVAGRKLNITREGDDRPARRSDDFAREDRPVRKPKKKRPAATT